MPYRRLPNTDNARCHALEFALKKGEKLPPFKLAFTQKTLQEAKYFLPIFYQAIKYHKETYEKQIQENKKYLEHQKKAKLYISHFIQVLNFSIIRGDLKPSERKYLGLDTDDKKVPMLNTENDLMIFGEKIINGEAKRLAKGLTPVTNPTIAMVKVMYEKFIQAYLKQKSLQEINEKALVKVANLRVKADTIILKIWNEVENTFNDLPSDQKRKKAIEYGLVYVLRKNEKNIL
ncbi:MAG: hypothetical protein KAT68_06860 [Bacteroidales bacterium]|nr:hypothetical protein [Bacteroidales bacterium]